MRVRVFCMCVSVCWGYKSSCRILWSLRDKMKNALPPPSLTDQWGRGARQQFQPIRRRDGISSGCGGLRLACHPPPPQVKNWCKVHGLCEMEEGLAFTVYSTVVKQTTEGDVNTLKIKCRMNIFLLVGAFSYNHPWRINTYAGILCPRHKTLFLVLLSFIRIKNSILWGLLENEAQCEHMIRVCIISLLKGQCHEKSC